MTKITITTTLGVRVDNNLLLLTYGDSHPYIIPINTIWIIEPPHYFSEKHLVGYRIQINDNISIETKVEYIENRIELHRLIDAVYVKLLEMMIDYHKDKHTIFKPKPYQSND